MTVSETEVTDEMLTAAMRAFELMSSVLRYREKDKWHSCDVMGMRDAIKAALAVRPAALSDQVVVASGHGLSINIEQRADGGIRIWSSQLKGLLLSGSDPVQVMAAVWPAITALINHKRFKTGDRVQHVGRGEIGTVTILQNGNVQVEFDNPTPRGHRSIGEYDKAWFEQYPNGLAAAPASTAGEG